MAISWIAGVFTKVHQNVSVSPSYLILLSFTISRPISRVTPSLLLHDSIPVKFHLLKVTEESVFRNLSAYISTRKRLYDVNKAACYPLCRCLLNRPKFSSVSGSGQFDSILVR